MKTFLTGGSGTIGKNFPESVIRLNIDLEQNKGLEVPEIKKCRFNFIHAAAIVGNLAVSSNLKKAYKINVESTKILAELCLSSDLNKFLYVSTSHVYKRNSEFIDENSDIEPTSAYSDQKRMAEIELTEIFRNIPEKLLILRVFSILDWDMPEYSLGGAVRKLISEKINLINYGDDIRDFMTPFIAAKTISELILNTNADGILNVCTSKPRKVSDAVGEMLVQAGKSHLTNQIIANKSSNPIMVGSNKKLLNYLPNGIPEWVPSLPFYKNEN